MKKTASFIFSPEQLNYEFSETHPFNQKRIILTMDLLKEMHSIDPDDIVEPRTATDEELLLAHDAKYIEIVKKASNGEVSESIGSIYGIGTEDTPFFTGMHDASALLVGGTLSAIEEVMEGRSRYALNLGGGLHHGFQGKASGFCIYNDSSVAIKYLQKKYGARVLYVDTDAHHGDGVQWTFYDDPDVCTFSIHETGRYLFPGTGNVTERGNGKGYGTSFNFPVDAFTEDDSFLHIYRTALREVAEYFKPDVILTQNGADAHYFDPLTHLYSTMKIYEEIPKLAKEIAEEYCDGRWIAIGGGGYDIWRVVPRAWSHLWLTMKSIPTPAGPLPEAWVKKWQTESPFPLIETWQDPPNLYEPVPRKKDIEEKNEQMLTRALHVIRKG
ncbi:acetoin utilization protein AcuC [Sporosarcina sp. P13]|uniref:acetoin utilization protein AcuC n=1 Tax=Sporosarcina sp. P13 TaxID=2048263 RepID=UPI000C1636D0|nr:acetoin utilization protein AcuC [Sporosarcina sp. P13]PIC65217.1 acetoin utilization protein AcuC [Sporosarcina sp. P13]